MLELDYHSGFRIGFLIASLAIALGVACQILPSIIRGYSWKRLREYLLASYSERMQLSLRFANEELLRLGTSRCGRAGQLLLAVGFTVLILTGLAWFALRILETYGTRH
jgi:hypothetical protein